MKILITGGAGFIGSAVIREALQKPEISVVNLDCLTYAGNLESLDSVQDNPRYHFVKANICDQAALYNVFKTFEPDAVMHLAAESHVDRSIDGPETFITTNVIGTFRLLEAARGYYLSLDTDRRKRFRFHHISTDEVFGSLENDGYFSETTAYQPSSPYSASKAASDHLVRAWAHTYQLPTLVTNCSNNYGPFQFPEKLVPLMILNALEGKELPVYGDGRNIRDWLYVEDHAKALLKVVKQGLVGETYAIGGRCERTNLAAVQTICDVLDEIDPSSRIGPRRKLIRFVKDRPGHDFRYAIDSSKIESELGWKAIEDFESGIRKTVSWYLEHRNSWCSRVLDGSYKLERLGAHS